MSLKLSVCIPMYNEEKIAENAARSLSAFLDGRFPEGDYEIIFSNDGSLDRCGDIINELTGELGHIRLVGYTDNRGKGSAVREAVLAAKGDIILYTDCDLAYGCEAMYDAYKALEDSDVDIIIGSRNINADGYEGYTFLRKLMSKTYIKVISVLAGFKYTDSQCGLKCLRREAAHKIFSECKVNRWAFDLEVLIVADMHKYRIKEYPVKIINHRESESKIHAFGDSVKMLRDVMKIKKLHKRKSS